MKRVLLFVLSLICISSFTMFFACQKPENQPKPEIVLNYTEVSIEVGETVVLVAEGGENYAWSTNNPSIATVDDGVVTGVQVGNAEITVKSGELSKICIVKVIASSKVPTLELDLSDKSILLDEEIALKPVLKLNGKILDGAKFTFASLDDRVVTVDVNGVVKGISYGQAEVSVTYEYDEFFDVKTVKFSVIRSAVLDVNKTNVNLVVEKAKASSNITEDTITVEKFMVEGQEMPLSDLRWESLDENVAVVNEGVISSIAIGQTIVSVYYYFTDGGRVSADITVNVTREQIVITQTAKAEIGYDYDTENSGNVVLDLPLSTMGVTESEINSIEDVNGNKISDGELTVSETWFGKGGATVLKVYTNTFIYEVPLTLTNTKPQNNFGKHTAVDYGLIEKQLENEDARENTLEFKSTTKSSGYYKALTTYGGEIGMYLSIDVYFAEFDGEKLSMGILRSGWAEKGVDFYAFDLDGKQITDLSAENIVNKWITLVVEVAEITTVSKTSGNALYVYFSAGVECVAYLDCYRYQTEENTFKNYVIDAKAEHYLMDEDGKYVLEESEYLGEKALGETVSASPKTFDGYIYEKGLSLSTATTDYGTTVLKFYYAKPGTVNWLGAESITLSTNQGAVQKYEAKDLTGTNAREGTYLLEISTKTGSCYASRITLKNPNGTVADSWLIMNVYIDEYSASKLTAHGMYGSTNFGSWSEYTAWKDFIINNFKAFNADGKEILDLSTANVIDKWVTLAMKVDKYTNLNSLSCSLFYGSTGKMYIEKYAYLSEEMLCTVFNASAVIEHYQMQQDGSYKLFESETVNGITGAGQTVTATPKTYSGYTFDSGLSQLQGKTSVGTLVLKLYYNVAGLITWEDASVLSIGERDKKGSTAVKQTWGGDHTYALDTAMSNSSGKAGVYKYTLNVTSGTITPYQAYLKYSPLNVSDVTGYWILMEVYIAAHVSSPLNVTVGWDGIDVAEKVFDENGTEITDLSINNLKGKWVTLAIHDTRAGDTATISMGLMNGDTGLREIYISKVACLSNDSFMQNFG